LGYRRGADRPQTPAYDPPIAPTTRFPIRFSRWFVPLATVLGIRRRQSAVEVADDEVAVRMAWAFRARIPRGHVSAVRPHPRVRFAVGVHAARRGDWIVNGSTDGIVELRLVPPARAHTMGIPVRLRRLRVSVEQPAELVAALAPPSPTS
jgi:hypothetical protein